jgi:hypothetical protein
MIRLAELDVLDPSAPLPRERGETWFLVRAGAEVLGEVRLRDYAPLSERTVRTQLAERFRERLYGLLALQPKSEPELLPASAVTVVVGTRRRPRLLEVCLRSIAALDPAPAEIIVVDNSPGDDETARLAAVHGARVVEAPQEGLSRARNAGLRAASTAIVAFVDDDTRLDRAFVAALTRAFAPPQVAATAGLIRPAELDTYPQICFEREFGGLGKGFERRMYHRDIVPIDAGDLLGVGPNLAFRSAALGAISGFDERLGPGTALEAGDDLDVLDRTLRNGGVVVYEPSQLLAHVHPRLRSELVRRVRHRTAALGRFAARQTRGDRTAPVYELPSFGLASQLPALAAAVRDGSLLRAQIALAHVAGSFRRWGSA